MQLSLDFQYFILFSVILLFPKLLLRFRIPTALTALALGFVTALTLGWFKEDQLLLMLSRLGITSLFLFAGMEVDIDELKKDANVLVKNLLKSIALIVIIAILIRYIFDTGFRVALVLALGLMTPSTGFILNSLRGYELSPNQEKWVQSKAIAKELVAIFLLFFILQTESMEEFLISTGTLIGMVLILPVLFKFFLVKIAPFAPDSEVTFLILIALLCGVITKQLGTYYLVGAFIVGMTAGRFRHFIEHEKSQKVLYSVSFFFSFFVPFYFYRAGLTFPTEILSWEGFGVGIAFLMIFLPIRMLEVMSSIWLFLRGTLDDSLKISITLLPTLIFGLVIATVLREQFNASGYLVSGLIVYTIGSSIIPWFFLKKVSPEPYDSSMINR